MEMSSLVDTVSRINVKEYWLDKKDQNLPGIYVFNNRTKNKFYVGQSVNVYKRVCQHFDGEGNQKLYWDVKTDDAAVNGTRN